MSRYTFNPMERLRLEVERDPEPGEYVNRIANPSGELGAWGWTTSLSGSFMEGATYNGIQMLRYSTQAGGVNEFRSAPFAVTEGESLRAHWDLHAAPSAGYRVRFRWYDITGQQLAQTTSDDIASYSPQPHWSTVRTVPAGVHYAALTFRVTNDDFSDNFPVTGAYFVLFNVKVFSSTMGPLTDAAILANLGAPTVLWENVLGPTHEITVKREEFDLGTLSATILDSSLDPSAAATLRPGRQVRLTALAGSASGDFEPLFTGTVDTADVQYDLRTRKASDPKHAQVTITAVDAMRALTATNRPNGVDEVLELPFILETGGDWPNTLLVPWNVDGYTGQIWGAPYTSSNDSASAADQVALVRDQNLGYAWIDRRGVLTVRSTLPTITDYTLDESAYSDIDLSYDTRRLINSVGVQVLSYDPGTGETTTFSPNFYLAPKSIQTWGKRSRTFTMTATKAAEWPDFPARVFAGNAEPRIQPRSVTVPILTDPDRAARGFVDLYDLVRVVNVDKGIDEQLRVTSLEHRITTEKWLMEVGFAGDTTVAIPQRQPAR